MKWAAVVKSVSGAIVGTVAVLALIPKDYWVAHRGYVDSATELQLKDVVNRNIAHYNKQVCYGTQTDQDLEQLAEFYRRYEALHGTQHLFVNQGQQDICNKLRVPYVRSD